MSKLCLILGDQLSPSVSSLQNIDKETDLVLMAEVREEATYVKHHQKKIALVFSAMRHFAQALQQAGYRVNYIKYGDEANQGSLFKELQRQLATSNCSEVFITEPGEYRLLQDMKSWSERLGVTVTLLPDERYLATTQEFANWASGKKQLRMEFFYREMRKKHQILMENGKPVGGKWNYDAQNRKKLPNDLVIPPQTSFKPDDITCDVLKLVAKEFPDHFGELTPFSFAVTRQQARQVLAEFIEYRLVLFGDFQDAMKVNEDWLFHSHISFYLNSGLLLPKEVIQAAEQAYHAGTAPLNAVEGFIRQVLGWREYVRGLYWLLMPEYKQQNHLEATRSLPDFYWTGETQMRCLAECVRNTKENAYAHHIQRLIILGNFALLTGLSPEQVNEWYLLVYADAYEWVELPNVSGMILFADGGVVASKPYAASGAYIQKMSNYCQHCSYNVKQKTGAQACPFNYLYWDFIRRHKQRFENNPRMAMIYRTMRNKSDAQLRDISESSQVFFDKLDAGDEV
ncbi:MAG: cryptochrome/photolyase family protein [Aestuariibacter sp.]